jgi:hypothetical protein
MVLSEKLWGDFSDLLRHSGISFLGVLRRNFTTLKTTSASALVVLLLQKHVAQCPLKRDANKIEHFLFLT